MRTIKNVLVMAAIIAAALLIPENSAAIYWLACFFAIVFAFNLLVRRSLYFKPYFLSKVNVFSAQYSSKFEVDLPPHLVFDKIKEVLAEGRLKLIAADSNKLEILAISPMSLSSWGENIYFSFEDTGHGTLVRFDSVAFFQLYTWGKNEENCKIFAQNLENSFTI